MVTKEERLAVLGRLSSTLAHEIRNPLAGISAATQLLGGKLDGADPRRRYVGMILKEVERVDEIVKNLLDYSRDGRACMMRTDLSGLVDAALETFRERLDAAGIRTEVKHDPAMPVVTCDMDMVTRVFRNLIANAIDAMPDGGRLTIRTAYEQHDDVVCVYVVDSGRGTDVDDLAELFSPFYTTKTKGSGLGLPVALKCIDEHDGTITAERGASGGLTFTVRWPARPPASQQGAPPTGTE